MVERFVAVFVLAGLVALGAGCDRSANGTTMGTAGRAGDTPARAGQPSDDARGPERAAGIGDDVPRGEELEPGGNSGLDEDRVPVVLVFSKTAGFRHASIPAGIAAVEAIGAERGFGVVASEDAGLFTDQGLAGFDAVVFLSTTGDILNGDQQAAFERFIAGGKGFVGIHAAADTEYDWAWYGELVGAYFQSHPQVQQATVEIEDPQHPSTFTLPSSWVRRDEWYDYRTNPRENERIRVLATLLESSYTGGQMGADHPIAWCQSFGGGWAWYTGGGHTTEAFGEPEFREHLAGGILWVLSGGQPATDDAPLR
ncbi:MAG: ThuA domain-containing protein [Phycisphaerales bacterium]|nr:ThuA domain-containing protein [Phycisphaerales bacterium]